MCLALVWNKLNKDHGYNKLEIQLLFLFQCNNLNEKRQPKFFDMSEKIYVCEHEYLAQLKKNSSNHPIMSEKLVFGFNFIFESVVNYMSKSPIKRYLKN